MLRSLTKSLLLLSSLAAFSLGGLLSQAQAGLTLYGSAFSSDFFDPNHNLSTLYQINEVSGSATAIGSIGFRIVGGIDFDSAGTLYGVGETFDNPPNGIPPVGTLSLITINRTTGAGTAVAALTLGGNPLSTSFQDISFRNGDGQLHAYSSGDLYTINKVTGAVALVGTTGEAEIGGGLAFTAADTLLKTGFDHLFSLDQSTGNGTALVQMTYPTGGTPNVTGMDFDAATGVLWAAVHTDASSNSPTYLATIDTVTGLVTKIGDSVIGLTALAAIPEASTYGVLAGFALVGVGMVSVARRKKAIAA